MRRWPTWLLVGALVALGSVAVADALREGESDRQRPPTPVPQASAPASERGGSGMNGVLYYSNVEDECRLDGLSLPGLGNAPPPKLRSCRFSLSPDGTTALPGRAAWSPRGGLYARESSGMVELGSPASRQALRFPGHAPAFRPDGTLTYVRDDAIVEWTTDCPAGARLFTLPGDNATVRCRGVVLTARDVRGALVADVSSIAGHAWLGAARALVLAGANVGPLGRAEIAVVMEEGRQVGATQRYFGRGHRIEASPAGGYYTVWRGDLLLAVRDRSGRAIVFPTFPEPHAVAWSPDEGWTAVATEHSIYLFRTNDPSASVRRIAVAAGDLAWR